MEVTDGTTLLRAAMAELRALLPEQFEVTEPALNGQPAFDAGGDAIWSLQERSSGGTELLVQAKLRLSPRDVGDVLGGLPSVVRRALRDPTVLVIAPWLSRRSRELLERRGYSYLDLTGNVLLRVARPAVYLRLQGADRDPTPAPRPPARVQGARANRLVRLLVDVAPPYRMTELAQACGLSQGYVSRLLESLDEQALITRDRRGAVTDVDWPALLTARADSYDLLKTNTSSFYVAPMGANELYGRLIADPDRFGPVTVTGSYAASAVAPVTAPAQLALYTAEAGQVREAAGLLPATRGADVVLLKPADSSQVDRARAVDGVMHVGLSQLVMDCLAGNGRLPEEGQAVLESMRSTEESWRLPTLPAPTLQEAR